MTNLNDNINELFGLNSEFLLIISGILLYYFHFLSSDKFFFNKIIITTFVLAIYDVFLKKILLFIVTDDYYKLIINNIITIVTIDLLISIIKDYTHPNLNFLFYFNLAFACLFYETIIFKLYNYNGLCNKRLRSITKTILRLTTIHILSNFLNSKDFNQEWFDFSISQILNFALFDIAFSEN
jgi:hypothetical protein